MANDSVANNIEQSLRRNGVQVTVQRIALLRALAQNPHSTADSLAEAVRHTIGTISRQSVYDSLGLLAEKGLIRRIQPAGQPTRYEDRVDDNHHHLACRACDAVVDVDCAVGYTPCLEAADDLGFVIDEAEVIYWGYCPRCVADGAAPAPPGTPADRAPHGDGQ